MRRQGFTLMETAIVVVIFSVVMLGVFNYFRMFNDIREKHETGEKFKYYSTLIESSIDDPIRARGLMIPGAVLDFRGSTLRGVEVARTNKLLPVLLASDGDHIRGMGVNRSSIDRLTEYLGLVGNNDSLFLQNMFVYITDGKYQHKGLVEVDYKNFTLIHINDMEANAIMKGDAGAFAEFKNAFLVEEGGFLAVNWDTDKESLRGSRNIPYYTKFETIRKSIQTYKFTSKGVVEKIVSTIDKKMDESQARINSWATIQARYAAYKSIDSGDTMDTDYFISCAARNTLLCAENASGDGQVFQLKTLIKNDDDTSDKVNNGINFRKLRGKRFKDIPSEYGFIGFRDRSADRSFSTGSMFSFTTSCRRSFSLGVANGVYPTGTIVGGVFVIQENPSVLSDTRNNSDYCRLPDGVSALLAPDVNPLGYDVFFVNTFEFNRGGSHRYTTVNGIGGKRTPIVVNAPYHDGGVRLTYSPYTAAIFTPLPNGSVIIKQVYASAF